MAVFGANILGVKSLDDADALAAQTAAWIQELTAQFAAVSPTWALSNATEEASYRTDLTALIDRVTAAKGVLDTAHKEAVDSWIPYSSSQRPADEAYVALYNALRQGGANAPQQTGDFADMKARLNAYLTSVKAPPVALSAPLPPPPEGGLGSIATSVSEVAAKAGAAAAEAAAEAAKKAGMPKIPWWAYVLAAIGITGYGAGQIARLRGK